MWKLGIKKVSNNSKYPQFSRVSISDKENCDERVNAQKTFEVPKDVPVDRKTGDALSCGKVAARDFF